MSVEFVVVLQFYSYNACCMVSYFSRSRRQCDDDAWFPFSASISCSPVPRPARPPFPPVPSPEAPECHGQRRLALRGVYMCVSRIRQDVYKSGEEASNLRCGFYGGGRHRR